VWIRAITRQHARVEAVATDRAKRRVLHTLITLSGLSVAAFLTMRADPEVRVAVALVFGAFSFAPSVLLMTVFAPAKPWAPVEGAAGTCAACGRYAYSLTLGCCKECYQEEQGPGTAGFIAADHARASAVLAEAEREAHARALGACPRCGGEAAFENDAATCRHCAAPLHPGDRLKSDLTDALYAQRARRELLRELEARHLRLWARATDDYIAAVGVAVGVVLVIAIALSVCFG